MVVSTQSPKALAPELLELSSVVVLHRFHSLDWFHYLQQKIPLDEPLFKNLMNLTPGDSYVFAARHDLGGEDDKHVFRIRVRPRITADLGASRLHGLQKYL